MEIPVTDKFWCKSKFDDNFNEISYIDNKGNSFEYIHPITNHLKYYKSDDIYISQEMLDNINYLKSDDPKEQLFLRLFSNLVLIRNTRLPSDLDFKQRFNHQTIANYCVSDNEFWINHIKIWLPFNQYFDDFGKTEKFLKRMFKQHLKLNIVNQLYFDF